MEFANACTPAASVCAATEFDMHSTTAYGLRRNAFIGSSKRDTLLQERHCAEADVELEVTIRWDSPTVLLPEVGDLIRSDKLRQRQER